MSNAAKGQLGEDDLKHCLTFAQNAKNFPPNFGLRKYPSIQMERAGYIQLNPWKNFVVIEHERGKRKVKI